MTRDWYYPGRQPVMPPGMVPMWKPVDEINLRNRVRRLIDRPEPVAVRPRPPVGKADWCIECKAGDHCKPARVGPYAICRCLHCPDLVIEDHGAFVVVADRG